MTFIAWLCLVAEDETQDYCRVRFARWYLRHVQAHVSSWTALNHAIVSWFNNYGSEFEKASLLSKDEALRDARETLAVWHELQAAVLREGLV